MKVTDYFALKLTQNDDEYRRRQSGSTVIGPLEQPADQFDCLHMFMCARPLIQHSIAIHQDNPKNFAVDVDRARTRFVHIIRSLSAVCRVGF